MTEEERIGLLQWQVLNQIFHATNCVEDIPKYSNKLTGIVRAYQ